MGREIRRVPAGWEHPKETRNGREGFKPLLDDDFPSAARRWKKDFLAWENGGRQKYLKEVGRDVEYWEYDGNPPNPERYRPVWTEEECTHYQMYETVSEGTPVSPVFATQDELVEYLVRHGDSWDQKRGDGGWKRENAEAFVRTGHAMSLIASGGKVYAPRDGTPK